MIKETLFFGTLQNTSVLLFNRGKIIAPTFTMEGLSDWKAANKNGMYAIVNQH